MAFGLATLVVFAFLLGCPGTYAEPQNSEPTAKCSLTGSWKNELNSTMEINTVIKKGVFSGVYKTAVSACNNPILPSPIVAVEQLGDRSLFAFTVSWNFTESITAFVGQCFLDGDGEEQLKTTWLLREKVESAAQEWGATRVGTNTFYRSK